MQVDALTLCLVAGPARRFDVRAQRRKLRAAEALRFPLFDNPRLNDGILLKGLPVGRFAAKMGSAEGRLATVVFLPTDPDNLEAGGASCFYAEGEEERRCHRCLMELGVAASTLDFDKLRVINSVPTFAKPLLDIAFRRAGIAVPACYAAFPSTLRARLDDHLRTRLRSLMVTAAATMKTIDVEKAVTRYIEALLHPSAAARDSLAPLVDALRLSPALGWDALPAWVGLAYYEGQMHALQPPSRDFLAWLKTARSRERLHRSDHEMMMALLQSLKQRVRETWHQLISLFGLYRDAHEQMAFNRNIGLFTDLLNLAPTYYRWVGEVLGRLEQCLYLWKQYTNRFNGEPLPYLELFELGTMLPQVLSPRPLPGRPGVNTSLSA